MYTTLQDIRDYPDILLGAVLKVFPAHQVSIRNELEHGDWTNTILYPYVDEIGNKYPELLQTRIVIINLNLAGVTAMLYDRDRYEFDRCPSLIDQVTLLLRITLQYLSVQASLEAADRMAS